jgi:hypothetical protein
MVITELKQTEIKVIAGGVIERVISFLIPGPSVSAALVKLNTMFPGVEIKVNGTNFDTKPFVSGSSKKTPDSDSEYTGHDAEYDGAKPRKICEQ